MLPERLTLQPIARFQGTLTLPGSKSLSNRVLLLSALADGETEVTRALDSEDTEAMLAALRDLGVGVRGEPGPRSSLWIAGQGGQLDAPAGRVSLFLGNAGTAMRPLTAVLAAGRGSFTLSGVPRMHERPIGDLLVGLEQLGASIHCLERSGYPPLSIEASGLRGSAARLSASKSPRPSAIARPGASSWRATRRRPRTSWPARPSRGARCGSRAADRTAFRAMRGSRTCSRAWARTRA